MTSSIIPSVSILNNYLMMWGVDSPGDVTGESSLAGAASKLYDNPWRTLNLFGECDSCLTQP